MLDINKTTAKYLVLDLTTFDIREEENGPMEDPNILNNDKCKTTELWLRRIEPGTFLMGSPEDELGRFDNETQHEVTLTKPFYIGVFQVTQKQYELITGDNPSIFKGDARPMESISYNDIRGYKNGSAWPENDEVDEISFMGQLRKKTCLIFDLPTEAQWEYACRAGTTTALNSGKNLSGEEQCNEIAEVGRYDYNYDDGKGGYSEHTKVGSYLPNAWGLYDMHGNIWEWCLDFYAEKLGTEPAADPKGPKEGSYRVNRGGDFEDLAYMCRSANRNRSVSHWKQLYCTINVGFRLALTL